MKFRVIHRTRYTYAEAVSLSHNIVRLRPRDSVWQTCLWHQLSVSPAPGAENDNIDYFGNRAAYFSLQESHTQLTIEARSEVELCAQPHADLSGPSWERVRDMLPESADLRTLLAREYFFDSPYVALSPDLADYARPSFPPGEPLLKATLDLTKRIQADFKFLPGSTKVGTPVAEVLVKRRGVCQDFAHLQIGCLRSLGLAARYVSGYLVTHPPPGGKRLVGSDVSHAWVGVYVPERGWVDFDPTNGVMPANGHITVAWARDYDDLGPIRGVLVGGRRQRLEVAVDVVPADAVAGEWLSPPFPAELPD